MPNQPAPPKKSDGFLPFHTNLFDRVFISLVILIGIHLLWLRFIEPILPILPIGIATLISLVIACIVIRWG